MDALVKATLEVLEKAGVKGEAVESIGIDTTGSSVIPVGENLEPLDDYYLWCDHRALEEAQADYRACASGEVRRDRLVRRRLFA